MKTLIFVFALFLALTAYSHEGHSHDAPSTHGMLLVGKSTLYLSHLPMFHSPHDYQVILEAQLDTASQAAYLKALGSSAETVYTIVPESFVLPDMINKPRPFRAQLYQGHFERGGKVIALSVTVSIKQVLHFKKFNPADRHPLVGSYILFGNTKEQFLAHAITAKPDFDQIVSVEMEAPALQEMSRHRSLAVSFPLLMNAEPLAQASVQASKDLGKFKVKSVLYLETGDLSF